MNKIFKLIWSKAKNCWVVASELAKGHAKSTSGRAKGSVLAASVLTVLLGSALFPMDAVYAADPVADGQTHYVSVGVKQGEKIKVRKNVYDANGHLLRVEEEEVEIDPTKNYNPPANPSVNFIGIGAELSQYGNGSVGVGFKSGAAEYGTALGTNARAGSLGDVAIGWQAFTSGFVGNKGQYTAPNKIAIGTQSTALEENGISIGTKSKTLDKNAIAIGNEAETGNEGGQSSNDSIAIGNKAKIQGQKNVAIGSGVTVGTGAKDNGSSYVVAIGSDSHAYDTDSIVIGGNSEVRENATVIGNRSKAGMESVALGSDIKAGEWSIAIGLSSKAHNHAIAMGMNSDVSGEYAIGIGEEARSFANQSVSMGYQAHAYVGESLAIGNSALVGGERITENAYNALSDAEKKNYTHDSYGNFYYKKSSESYYSTAVGPQARVYGKNATALGSANVGDIFGNIIADGGTAVGSSANAAYENATAVGYNSIAYAKDAVTLGANTRADIDGGVALGSDSNVGSYASSSYGKAGKVGYDPLLGTGADETSTWKSTKAAVSVGNQQKDITRQIINVAAGTDNTDAVNVAQLKTLGRKAWKDLAAAKDELGGRIAGNTTSITKLSTRVGNNEREIGTLKTDVNTNDRRIRYLYDNMPFMHYVSVNEENTNKTTDNRRNNGAKKVGSIAIGVNAASDGEDAVTLGGNSFSRGQGSVIVGESSDNYNGGSETVKKGQFDQSIILGSNNTIFAQSAENGGREDKIIGNMNRVEESHGTFVRGTGNMVYDAYNDEALTDEDKQKEQDFLDPIDGGDPRGLFQKGRSHVTVEGDGNLVGGALYTQISGVSNEVSYSDGKPRVSYNIVTGNRNTVTDSSHNLIMGDNHELENVNGNIIIGSLKTKAKTTASNVTVLGNEANVSVEGGVALGTGSVASTAAGALGYISLNPEKAKTIEDGYKAMGEGDAYEYHAPKLLKRAKSYEKRVHEYEEAVKNYEQETDAGKKRNLERIVHRAKSSMESALKAKQKSEEAASLEAAWKSTQGAVSVGGYTVDRDGIKRLETRQITGVAAGTKDSDAVNVAQLKASTTRYFSVNEVTPETTYKTSFPYTRLDEWGYSVHGNQINDGAKGEGAVAVGENAEALQKYGSAFGYGAKAKQEQSLALGLRAEAEGSGSVAMGGFSIVEQTGRNSLALGQHSRVTAANSVALGAESFVGTLDGIKTDAYLTGDKDKFTADNGVVSVGRTGYKKWTKTWTFDNDAKAYKELLNEVEVPDSYRRIVNVAGGAADTDAVNVAQLKAARTTVKAGDYATVTEGKEQGVDGTVYTVKGPTLSIDGGNLTVADAEETIEGTTDKRKIGYKLSLNKELTGLTSVSSTTFKAGNDVTLGATGLTIANGPSVTTTGIDANNTTITKVAAGAADTDAVNFGQLKDVKSIATTNQTNITKLQNGFTVKDGGTGKADVALGGDTKQEVTFNAAVDKTTEATENGSSLTSTVDTNRNVTYSLNMKQLKKDLGITDGTDGVMSSWKLQAKGDTAPQDIKNGEAVTFDASGNGLTVKRDGKTIKYGIDGSKIDISNNKSSVHYVSVYDAKKTGNFDNDGAKKDGGIAIGLRAESNGWNSIALGSDSKATGIQANAGWNIAIGTKAQAEANMFATAIGYMASASKDKAIALGTMAKTETEDGVSIGAIAKSLGKRGIAIGSVSEVSATGGLGIAIGNAAYVGPAKSSDTTAMPKPSDEWKPANPYESVDDNTKPGANEGAQEKAMAIGFKAGAYGYQATALGAAAQAHDSNTTAVGVAAVARGHYSTALGMQARTFDKESTSVGHWADSRAEFATAVGANTIVYKKGGVALGSGARAYDENSVAIGSNSFAKEAVDGEAYLSKEAIKAAAGIVSVGNPNYKVGDTDVAANYRRIVNVAGGIHDNDAVNVLQLKALEGKVTTNTEDITTLKKGWTLEDGNATKGTKTVKAEDTVKVTGDDYIKATVSDAGLALSMDETKLNKQINNQIDNSTTVTNKMNSWVLKAATTDKDPAAKGQTIDNDNKVATFDVEKEEQGLTVARDGATIKYGVDKAKLAKHITGDVITNINDGSTAVTNISAKFSVTDGTNTKAVNLGKDKNNNVKFLGTTDETTVTVGGNDDAPTVTVGLDSKFKKQVTDNTSNIAENKTAIGENKTAIGENKTAIGENKTAIGENKTAIGENKTAIGENKTAIGENKTAIGENKTAIGENKTAIGENKTAIGENKTAIGENKTAIGENKTAIGENKTAIGENKTAIGENKTAIGENKTAIGENKTAIGENKTAIGENKTAIDKNTKAIGENKTAIDKKMTSWTVKAGEESDGQKIDNDNNEVTFDVAEKDKGLTVERKGSTIKYGIDGKAIDISENTTVNELKEEIENSKTTVKAGDYVTVTDTTPAGKKGKEYTVIGPTLSIDGGNLTVNDDEKDGKKIGYKLSMNKDISVDNVTVKKKLTAKTVDTETVNAGTVNTKTVKASDKVMVGDKVTLGTTGLTIEKGPSVTAAGIDAGKKKITNVADGAVSEKSTEAVNGRQLFGVEQKVNINSQNISILGGKVNELNARVDRVSAGTAALAALHPLDFDPDDKWDFAAGYGNYKGANAAAIGAYYRPNEDTMFSVGGSFGGGENMVNAGVSVKFGQGNHVTTSRIAMAKEIKDLRAEVEVLRQAVTGIRQGKTPDPVKMKLFPDIAKNHWAYEAVEELTKQGLLEGYPDGTFGGDRMMTRYEFAEIVYRAVQKGLNVSEKLIQEFEPELERFRVDVISKDKDGNPVIERVRVNEKKRAK